MGTLAVRTVALFAAGALLASCGGSGNGNGNGNDSSAIDEVQDSISDATGLDVGDTAPPQSTPEELLLRDVQVAGYDFGSETIDLEQIRQFLGSDIAAGFQIEPEHCDSAISPANLDRLSPETTAMRMAMATASGAAVGVSTETEQLQDTEEDIERCGEMTLRSDLGGLGEIVLNTNTETFDLDAPSGTDHVVGYTEHTTGSVPQLGDGGLEEMMPAAGSVSISGVVRDRAIFVHLSATEDSVTTEQLKSEAQEIFAAQVDKIKDAD